jgi:hypothetical protein
MKPKAKGPYYPADGSHSLFIACLPQPWLRQGSLLLALGSWLLVLGSWFLALGSWLLALGFCLPAKALAEAGLLALKTKY